MIHNNFDGLEHIFFTCTW